MENKKISTAVIRRLPRYYRFLTDLLCEGVCRISSDELSRRMRMTASQIRQDLNNFGGFGQQGYGYNVENLKNEIGKLLGLDKSQATSVKPSPDTVISKDRDLRSAPFLTSMRTLLGRR